MGSSYQNDPFCKIESNERALELNESSIRIRRVSFSLSDICSEATKNSWSVSDDFDSEAGKAMDYVFRDGILTFVIGTHCKSWVKQ